MHPLALTVSFWCDAARTEEMQFYGSIWDADSQTQVSLYGALVRYQVTQLASHIQCNAQAMAFKVTGGEENLFWERRKENVACLV